MVNKGEMWVFFFSEFSIDVKKTFHAVISTKTLWWLDGCI